MDKIMPLMRNCKNCGCIETVDPIGWCENCGGAGLSINGTLEDDIIFLPKRKK